MLKDAETRYSRAKKACLSLIYAHNDYDITFWPIQFTSWRNLILYAHSYGILFFTEG